MSTIQELMAQIEALKAENERELAIREARRAKNIYQSGKEIPLSQEDKLLLAVHIQMLKLREPKTKRR